MTEAERRVTIGTLLCVPVLLFCLPGACRPGGGRWWAGYVAEDLVPAMSPEMVREVRPIVASKRVLAARTAPPANRRPWCPRTAVYAGRFESRQYIGVGDADYDGDVDLLDFMSLAVCWNGSLRPPKPACTKLEKLALDFDNDNDVDGFDFLTFSTCYNGVNRKPACYNRKTLIIQPIGGRTEKTSLASGAPLACRRSDASHPKKKSDALTAPHGSGHRAAAPLGGTPAGRDFED